MSRILPVNLSDLLHARTVESERIEFKANWNPTTTGHQMVRTICAFANDYHRLNGGYVVIGVEERDGRAALPPQGLDSTEVEAAQRWISGRCKQIRPPYQPILSPEVVEGRHVLVVWAPGSDVGGHRACTPFDDCLARDASIEDLRESKVREHLKEAESTLLDEPDAHRIFRRMRIVGAANGYAVPRNVGLLLFSADPCEWFWGARIEVARFADDRAGDVQDERIFKGGLIEQVRDALVYLDNMSGTIVRKNADRPEASAWHRFPADAVREALVNAICHRSYREDAPDPIKVNVFPDRMVIASYPGPVPGIRREHFAAGAEPPEVSPRNRRIAEFLKELRLAELHHTGVPKIFRAMEANGSPPPEFDFDEDRTYFQVTLRAHPIHAAVTVLRNVAELRAIGQTEEAEQRLENAWSASTRSAALAVEMIRLHSGRGSMQDAQAVLETFVAAGGPRTALVVNALAEEFLRRGEGDNASAVLTRFVARTSGRAAIAAGILARQANLPDLARRHFEQAGTVLLDDPRGLLEYCQNKLTLVQQASRIDPSGSHTQLLQETETLLRRVLRLDTHATRHAWAWRELARTLEWLGRPFQQVVAAYRSAIELAPGEDRFRTDLHAYELRVFGSGRPR